MQHTSQGLESGPYDRHVSGNELHQVRFFVLLDSCTVITSKSVVYYRLPTSQVLREHFQWNQQDVVAIGRCRLRIIPNLVDPLDESNHMF